MSSYPPSSQASDALLDVHAVAARLAVSHYTVRRLVRQSRLKALRLGHSLLRFRDADVIAFIEKNNK